MSIFKSGFRVKLRNFFDFGKSFRESVIESSEPISADAFDSITSFAKEVFKYNKYPILIYLLICTLRSLEQVIRNIPFRSFMIAVEKYGSSIPGGGRIWDTVLIPIVQIIFALLLVDCLYRAGALLLAYFVRPNIEYSVTRKITNLLMTKPHNFFGKHPNTINNRIHQLAEGAYDAIIMLIDESIPSILGALGTIAATAFINKTLGIIMFAYFVSHTLIVLVFYKKYIKLASCNSLSYNNLVKQTLNLIQNMPQIKAFGAEKFESNRINTFQNRRRKTNQIAFSYPERMRLILTCNHVVSFVIMLLTQVYFLSKGVLSIADITFILGNIYGIIQLLYVGTIASVKLVEDIGRCSEGLSLFKGSKFDTELRINKKYPKRLKDGGIIFKNVSFYYPNSRKVLFHNKNITIKPMERIGVVGLSGSGKSTFVNLIMGYFLPSSGSVSIGGYNTSKTDLSWLRSHITIMSQTPQLFDRTILSNLQYGNYNTDKEEIFKICEKLGTDLLVNNLPYGYYTSIVDGGVNLSGGQRQRIALTRAMAKKSQILILDEATSAMDSYTQSIMNKGIKELMIGKTTIVIAHKLETIIDMDRILVFKEGEIVEVGSHKELIRKRNSHYTHLWRLSSSRARKG